MNRFTRFAFVVVAVLALSASGWASSPAGAAPAAESPQATVGKVVFMRNGQTVVSAPVHDGKNHLIGYLGFEVYLVVAPGDVSLEVDPPLIGDPVKVKLAGGPKKYSWDGDIDPLGRIHVELDLF